MPRMKRRLQIAAAVVGLLLLLACLWIAWLNVRGEEALPQQPPFIDQSVEAIAKGEYLARAGNCIACHTARGGLPYAGGLGIETPFGLVFSSNLTPDAKSGLGQWNAAEFWRALRHGRSRDGRLLSPAFPYTSYRYVTREDADAIFAYLQSLPAVQAEIPAHDLRWPFNTQVALAIWRALYWEADATLPYRADAPEWNRGLYLVEGLGHCAACHTARDRLGGFARGNALGGGMMPVQNWYAPALNHSQEAGLAEWEIEEIVRLFQTGIATRGNTLGPMADVVWNSLQYLSEDDLRAMGVYLQSLPQPSNAATTAHTQTSVLAPISAKVMQQGRNIYEQQCMLCHGATGEGVAGIYPALAGNRAVLMPNPSNIVQMILKGGYAPATAGNPRPHGMPPFLHVLTDTDIAQVSSYIRNAWGNHASAITSGDVFRAREGKIQN